MRLDKYLAEALQITRSESRTLLARGAVRVDGVVCKKADAQISPEQEIATGGKTLSHEEFVYLMLNKPQGVVSAREDKRDVTVTDLVVGDYPRRNLFPAGRLDKTSTGFVLLTDDGVFAHDLVSPRRHVPKTYAVLLDTPLTEEMRHGFESGVTLKDGQVLAPAEVYPAPAGVKVWAAAGARVAGTAPADAAMPSAETTENAGVVVTAPDARVVIVVLHQGVYHQIKRMFGVYGAGVDGLHRMAVGGVLLDAALKPGEWRPLTGEEKRILKERD